jgi:hypothetical protein
MVANGVPDFIYFKERICFPLVKKSFPLKLLHTMRNPTIDMAGLIEVLGIPAVYLEVENKFMLVNPDARWSMDHPITKRIVIRFKNEEDLIMAKLLL